MARDLAPLTPIDRCRLMRYCAGLPNAVLRRLFGLAPSVISGAVLGRGVHRAARERLLTELARHDAEMARVLPSRPGDGT